jgi:adenosylmethionine-8-amino-7-oxononanoate aminotransferase
MNDTPEWLRDGLDHIWLPYTQMKTASLPLGVAATDGARLILEDGRTLIDGCTSWWTACHGYNHAHLADAVRRQLDVMPHVMMGGLANEQAYTLARRLADLLPGDLSRVFLAESGSVSIEVAMKMAVQYWINRGEAGHTKFVCFENSYHGDTLGTMQVGDMDQGMHGTYKDVLPQQHLLRVPIDDESRADFEYFLEQKAAEIAAVMIEPLVQGAGGFKFHDEETLKFIRFETDRHGVLLICDEIMTGFGRTGSMFACEQAGIVPDMMTLSKALTGGTLPLSATISSAQVNEVFLSDDPNTALMHGPTFMGNPLACAAANASLDLFEQEPRLEQVVAIERHMKDALPKAHDIQGVADVRVKGAIGVIELAEMRKLNWLKQRFVDCGVFIRPLKDVIYITPPFTIEQDDLAQLTNAMLQVTSEWSNEFYV